MYGIIAISIVAVLVVIAVRLFMQNSQQQSLQPSQSSSNLATQPLPRRTRVRQALSGHWQRQRRRWIGASAAFAVLGALVIGLVVVGNLVFYSPSSSPEAEENVAESSDPATPVEGLADECPDGHIVEFPSREGNRLNAEGVQAADTEGFRQEILDQASSDPLTLFHYYQASPLAERNPLEKPEELVDGSMEEGNCYSEEGIRAFNEWAVLWNTADLTPTEQVSHTGVNTGVDGDQPTHSHGVGGSDQSGFDVAYRDASGNTSGQHSVLNRCTQPTLDEAPPGVPPGPTDQPEEEQPPPQPEQPAPQPEQPEEEQPPPPEEEVKDPTKGPIQNPDIPEVERQPGETPPGGDPGEPDPPEDHDRSDPDIADDGCRGDCPQAEPEQPEADPERTPDSTDQPPEPDEPTGGNNPEGNDPGGCEENENGSCGYEQPNSNDGSPEEGDSSSGGGEDGVIEEPSSSDDTSSSNDSSSEDSSPQPGDDNPQHDEDDPEDEPSSGSSEDTSDVSEDTNADQDEDESNDESGSNPF